MAKKHKTKRSLKADEPDQPTLRESGARSSSKEGRARAPSIRLKVFVPAASVSAKGIAKCTCKKVDPKPTELLATESCN